MQARYENWVERPERRLADQPAAVLRRAVPGLVPARRRRRAGLRPRRSCRRGRRCRSTRRPTRRPATPRTSAASRAASSATPTSWTPGRPRRSPRRSPCGWERDDDLFARVFPMDLRPQAHDIIRTWLFSTVLRVAARARHAAVAARRASPAGSSTPTARRCRSPRATWSPRSALLERVRLGRGALLGRQRPARHRHRLRPGPDEDRPAAGDQAAQRRRSSCSASPRPRSGAEVTEPLDRAMLAALARWSPRPPTRLRRLRLHRRARGDRAVLLDVLRRLPRAGQGSAPTATTDGRPTRAQAAAGAPALSRAAAAVRAVPAVRDRGGLVLVARRLRAHQPMARPSAGDRSAAGGTDAGTAVIAAAAAVISAIRKAKSEARLSMRAPVRTVRVHGPAAEVDVLRAARGDIAAAGHVDTLLLEAGPGARAVHRRGAGRRLTGPGGPVAATVPNSLTRSFRISKVS